MKKTSSICIFSLHFALFPTTSFSEIKPIMTTNLLENLRQGEPWDRGVITSTKMATFQQLNTFSPATRIARIRLAYFTSINCSGTPAGTGAYTTPAGSFFSIDSTTTFGLVAASVWNVGSTRLSISNMAGIGSIAVTFKSTDNNTPQSNFSGMSFDCLPVACTAGPLGQCISSSLSTQYFSLNTITSIGDPVDGGIVGCQNTGSGSNRSNLIVATTDQSTGQNFAAASSTCSSYKPLVGGYNTVTWALASGGSTSSITQTNCLNGNQTAIEAGFAQSGGTNFNASPYWTATISSGGNAWDFNFSNNSATSVSRTLNRYVRCVSTYTP